MRKRVRWTSFSAPGSALLRAHIALVFRRGSDAPPLLVDPARRLEALDPALARETYLEALGAAMYAGGRLSADSGVLEAARAAPAAPQPPRSIDLLLDGRARRRTGAWRGVEADAMELINAGLENPTSQGEGRVVAMAGYAAAALNNGLGRYEAAVDGAMRGSDDGDWGYAGASLPEIVEAATRSGRPEVAAAVLPRLEERTRAAGTDRALGVLARSRALLSEGDVADALYREAIERLERTRIRVELARALGADGFAERARRDCWRPARPRARETRTPATP